MGTIPAPNIAEMGGTIAAAPQNRLAEFARVAQLEQATAASQQQQQENAQSFPLEQQQRQQAIDAQKRQMADQDALTKTLAQYDPNKHTLADIPKLVTGNGGSGQAALNAQTGLATQKKALNALSDEQFAQEQKKADLIQGVHDRVSQAPAEQKQQEYEQGLQALGRSGVDVSKEPPQYPGDEAFAQHLPAIRLHSAIVAESEKERDLAVKEQEANAKDWKEGGGGTLVNVNPKSKDFGKVVHGAGPLDQQELAAYLANPRLDKGVEKDAATFASWKAKQSPMGLVLGNQLGAAGPGTALDQAAERYATTGTLPAGFSRSPGTMTKIMQRAAELHPDDNIAGNSAVFAANKKALGSLQDQFSKVSAFENTAGKNLDVFLKQAGKVIDSGSPWINNPLRSVDAKALGDTDQVAFNTARTTALTEIAKVLNSPTGAGVLSDSARHEVEGLIGADATLKQIVSAANILKQDMANRHESYAQEIGNLQKAVGGKGAGSQSAAQQPTGHKAGDTVMQGGHKFKVTAVDANGKVTAADPL